ncbi:uncharacterized protein LOC111347029 [Stylophora pistillata]|uniref:uncharacterized protein LOC111347029 n=1 Tax=Stylophora pistillata TaxID=50429 RepID=UPI000C054028|nr:uncharacterized protein LOC111347029 [Stylophora pistillata]
MNVDGESSFLPMDQKALSPNALIADGQYRATSLGRDEWKKLIGPAASLQEHRNHEEFNSFVEGDYRKVRIGILGNEQGDCSSPDSMIGFGGSSFENTCGNTALGW